MTELWGWCNHPDAAAEDRFCSSYFFNFFVILLNPTGRNSISFVFLLLRQITSSKAFSPLENSNLILLASHSAAFFSSLSSSRVASGFFLVQSLFHVLSTLLCFFLLPNNFCSSHNWDKNFVSLLWAQCTFSLQFQNERICFLFWFFS